MVETNQLRGEVQRFFCSGPGIASAAAVVVAMMGVLVHAQSSDDRWDVSAGVVITSQSGVIAGSSIYDIFGATNSTVGAGYTMFRDDMPAGFVHYVEWRTPQPIELTTIDLFANHDGPPFDANERGFSTFRLMARDPQTLEYQTVYSFLPTNPYTFVLPNFHLVMTSIYPKVVAQEFRAEFVQFGDRTPGARGPRIVELDGFGAIVPEPCLTSFAGAGVLSTLFQRPRRRRPAVTKSDGAD